MTSLIAIPEGKTFPEGTTYGKTNDEIAWCPAPAVDPLDITGLYAIGHWAGKFYPVGTRSVVTIRNGSITFTPKRLDFLVQFFSGLGLDVQPFNEDTYCREPEGFDSTRRVFLYGTPLKLVPQ